MTGGLPETSKYMSQTPRVGIGVLVQKGDQFLFAKRKNAHGEGLWGGVGGHLEHLESFAECAKRETMEEVGIEIGNIRFLCVTNFKDHAPKHYVDIGLLADWVSGEAKNLEPDKKEEVQWFGRDNLPEPLFGMMPNYLKAMETGEQYFDA